MALNEWRIWKKLRITKPKPEQHTNINQDLEAIKEFLKQTETQKRELQKHIQQLQQLRHEEKIINIGKLKQQNQQEQIKIINKIKQNYQILHEETDLNKQRLEMIEKELLGK